MPQHNESSGNRAAVRKVRVGVIGCGGHANAVHYPSLAEFEDVEFVGVCDLIPERLHSTADRFGIEARFTDYKEMIERASPEAVYIITAPHHLFDIVVHCLRQKLHVFIEKPPGVYSEQTRNMARLAERNGCLTMVGFNRRFIPLLRLLKGLVEERGQIQQCVATFYKHWVGGEPYYGGAVDILTCDAIHAVDSLRWMAGSEAKKLVSSVRKVGCDFADSFNALIEFENGCVGILLANWAAGKRVHTFEMHGMGISVFANPDMDGEGIVYADDGRFVKRITSKEAAGTEQWHKLYGFYDENRHFIDCVKSGTLPQTHFGDAVKTMELVDAIYQNRI
ncbi:MAG: Gfo/Idh/MocA family oxidoreductase [Armatimonadota bacterium]|nr:Gfo/Idh/MocA family oxidoreductase [Armatimonadota bacterium]MCX7777310.1 Gfo/Idh/MocA family oxidoreductase [Armatimonadota bacterium]MDW8024373.1 Gfo/Idh/MocA family oxidoreductase [Armatimonadota bacterium]